MSSRSRLAVAGAAALALVFDAWQLGRRLLNPAFQSDFLVYYEGALTGRLRGWSNLYDFEAQREVLRTIAPAARWSAEWGPFWNPPPLAWLVSPLTWLGYPLAAAVWLLLLLGCWLLTWHLLAPGRGWSRLAQLVALAALFPWVFGLALGQVDGLLAAAVAVGWWLLRRRHPAWAGLALTVIALKPHPLLLVPLALLAAGHVRFFAWWGIGTIGLTLLSLLSLGGGGVHQVLTDLAVAAGWQQAPLTLRGLLGPGWLGWLARGACAAASLAVAWRWRAHGPEVPIAAGIIGSSLVAPFLHLQDLALLMLAGWCLLRSDAAPAQRRLLFAGYLCLAAAVAAGAALVLLQVAWLGWMLVRGTSFAERVRLRALWARMPAAQAASAAAIRHSRR